METKEKILLQTFDLIMKYGIKSVSMDDISRGIGISKKTIYQFFENKKTLISEVICNYIKKDETDMKCMIEESKNAIDEMVLIAKHVLKFLRRMSPSMMYDTQKYYPKVWSAVENEHFSFIHHTVKENIKRGQKEGLYNSDLNGDIVSQLYVRLTLALADEAIFPLSDYSRTELYKSMVTYHIRGLMNDKGRAVAQNLIIE